jgi:hypothetical protein
LSYDETKNINTFTFIFIIVIIIIIIIIIACFNVFKCINSNVIIKL